MRSHIRNNQIGIREEAERALEHVNKMVIKSSTHPQVNAYDQAYAEAIIKGVEQDFRSIPRDEVEDPYQIATHAAYQHELSISLIKKYSIGNCSEMAYLAMDYALNSPNNIRAEVFQLSPGDHVFAVFGRPEGSDESNPATWGGAYICDPWSRTVYPAIECPVKLQAFKRVEGKNITYPYDPMVHKLVAPVQRCTDFLDALLDVGHLHQEFSAKISAFRMIMMLYKADLDALKKSFSLGSNIQLLLEKKIAQLGILIDKIEHIQKTPPNIQNYRERYQLYTATLDDFKQITASAIEFTAAEIKEILPTKSILTETWSKFNQTLFSDKIPANDQAIIGDVVLGLNEAINKASTRLSKINKK